MSDIQVVRSAVDLLGKYHDIIIVQSIKDEVREVMDGLEHFSARLAESGKGLHPSSISQLPTDAPAKSAQEPPGDLVDYRPIPRENSVRGIGRTGYSRTVILVSFDEEPTASEMRSFHEYVRSWRL